MATSYPDEVSVGELNLREARRLAADRREFWKSNDKKHCLAEVRRLVGLRRDPGPVKVESRSKVDCDGYSIERLLIQRQGDVPIPALLFLPDGSKGKHPATLYVDGRGKRAVGLTGRGVCCGGAKSY